MPRQSSRILELARKGAEHRLEELLAEIATLIENFPHLNRRAHRRPQIDLSSEPAAIIDRKPRGRRRGMSAAARKAASQRMKKYWAARRAGKKK
jgi:hypothetical protein